MSRTSILAIAVSSISLVAEANGKLVDAKGKPIEAAYIVYYGDHKLSKAKGDLYGK